MNCSKCVEKLENSRYFNLLLFHEVHLKTWFYSAIFDPSCYMFWFAPSSTCTLHTTFDLFLYCRFLLRKWISLCLNDAHELMVDFCGVEFFVGIESSAENQKMLIGLFHIKEFNTFLYMRWQFSLIAVSSSPPIIQTVKNKEICS